MVNTPPRGAGRWDCAAAYDALSCRNRGIPGKNPREPLDFVGVEKRPAKTFITSWGETNVDGFWTHVTRSNGQLADRTLFALKCQQFEKTPL